MKYKIRFCAVLILSSIISEVFADSIQKDIRYTPYCGISCVYAILKSNGIPCNFEELVTPNYITSRKGSRMSDLKKAITTYGFFAECISNLTTHGIKNGGKPVILHVRSNALQKEYDHFVLYIGDKDGKAKVFDPPNRVETIPYYELARRWDGSGLIVSAEPINLGKILAPARKRFALFASIVIAAIVLVRAAGSFLSHKVKTTNKPLLMGFSAVQSAGLVVAALLVGIIYHFANDEGFLAHAGATESVVKANLGRFIPKLSANDVKNANGAVVIDARRAADYDAGHIEGAINIPTTLCAAGRSAKLGDTPKDSRVIIYCQSAGCPYAEAVAAHLTEDGFNNLAIYKGGWVDWQKTEQKNETK